MNDLFIGIFFLCGVKRNPRNVDFTTHDVFRSEAAASIQETLTVMTKGCRIILCLKESFPTIFYAPF